jgi:hypothetical protein
MNTEDMLLTQFSEEAAEIIKEVSKILRFGKEDSHPDDSLHVSNVERLRGEFVDFLGVASKLQDLGVLPRMNDPDVAFGVQKKRQKVERYLEVSRKLGRLND